MVLICKTGCGLEISCKVKNCKWTIRCLYVNLKLQNYFNQALLYELTNYINSLINEGIPDPHFLWVVNRQEHSIYTKWIYELRHFSLILHQQESAYLQENIYTIINMKHDSHHFSNNLTLQMKKTN